MCINCELLKAYRAGLVDSVSEISQEMKTLEEGGLYSSEVYAVLKHLYEKLVLQIEKINERFKDAEEEKQTTILSISFPPDINQEFFWN